eukprot:100929-Amphidinium_carterae.1
MSLICPATGLFGFEHFLTVRQSKKTRDDGFTFGCRVLVFVLSAQRFFHQRSLPLFLCFFDLV